MRFPFYLILNMPTLPQGYPVIASIFRNRKKGTSVAYIETSDNKLLVVVNKHVFRGQSKNLCPAKFTKDAV
jgi:hypothetical protein